MQEQLAVDTQALMREGIAAAKAGDRELARDKFLQLVRERANDDLAWVCLASLTDSLQIRIGYLKKALDLNPNNQKASEFLATTKRQFSLLLVRKGLDAKAQDDLSHAEHFLLSATEMDPLNEQAWMELAMLNDPPEDRALLLRRVLEINPGNTRAQSMLQSLNELKQRQAANGASVQQDIMDLAASAMKSASGIPPAPASAAFLRVPPASPPPDAMQAPVAMQAPGAPQVPAPQEPLAWNPKPALHIERSAPAPVISSPPAAAPPAAPAAKFEIERNGRVEISQPPAPRQAVSHGALAPREQAAAPAAAPVPVAVAPIISTQAAPVTAPESSPTPPPPLVPPPASTEASTPNSTAPLAAHPAEAPACPLCTERVDADAVACPGCKCRLTIEQFLDAGKESPVVVDQRKMLLAISRLSELVAKDSGNAQLHVSLGLAYLNLHRTDVALRCLRKANDLNPALNLKDKLEVLSRPSPAARPASSAPAKALEPARPAAAKPLPAAPPEPAPALTEPARPTPPASAGESRPRGQKTALIVDDSPTIRKMVSVTLERSGFAVIAASDGLDGLAKLNESSPDIVLLDIMMPKLDGYQVCKVIRESHKDLPVVMLSGKDGFFDKVRGKMAGSTAYITKPFEQEALVSLVREYTGVRN